MSSEPSLAVAQSRRGRLRGAAPAGLAGIGAAALGVGLGELTAAFLQTTASPIVAVGALLIDLAPPWAKDTAIALFGTADKIALIALVAVVLLVVAAIAGVLERARPPWGRVLIGLIAAIGAVAVATRTPFSPLDTVPPLLAMVVAVLTLQFLAKTLADAEQRARQRSRESAVVVAVARGSAVGATGRAAASVSETEGSAGVEVESTATPAGVDRRRFLIYSGASLVVGVIAAASGAALSAGTRAVTAVREAIALPAAAVKAAAVPAGAQFDIPGLPPVVTPNADFYRIDTALSVPLVNPEGWSLRIHGLVDNEVTITWDELLALPLEESITTLMCVSNEVGGGLIGNALWLGYPLRELLKRAGPQADADMVLSKSADGWTASTPIGALTDDRNAILAVGMNGEPLPAEHGFPVRMVVPGLYGYVSATKWVVDLEVTRFDRVNAYWTDRGWSAEGPIKIGSRIDVPSAGSLNAGPTTIAGFAWQQHTGIEAVEVQIDDGEWMPTQLAAPISDDTWLQWKLDWDAPAGEHSVRVRATSSDGEVQTDARANVVPDGATGHHEITVNVTA
ncbi:molybdopterin-dependent oxidoreductase [Pseudoclavibacter sp. RFBA6]|uniref:molybdopterin-dependent oxidoreductase n=1 Tax=Pseudoclavibacter sp. RFBA6 TaxID=2080573 RepID=UPI000CE75D5A|nr:molybdopterin-dependent oxidoreductase [Pseudoclavibacter sp. RFBA6]PPG43367.1 oxidoreductase [Pseudoclavibacter sp. RFBA6]